MEAGHIDPIPVISITLFKKKIIGEMTKNYSVDKNTPTDKRTDIIQ